MKVDKLVEFLDSVGNFLPLIEITDCAHWCILDDEEVRWVEGKNVYSGEITEGTVFQEGYMMTNLDTQQGYWITRIFSEDKRLSEEDFYDKYEDLM